MPRERYSIGDPMICPDCQREITPEENRCPECGSPLRSPDVFDLDAQGTVIDSSSGTDSGTVFEVDSSDDTVVMRSPETVADSRASASATGSNKNGPLEPGQSFGKRYRIIELLGLGGMGAVYKAWDTEVEIEVALKVIRPEAAADPKMAAELDARFKRELLLAREVTHHNVVRIHDIGEIDGIKYITMSYIEGDDLGTMIRRRKALPIADALRITRDMVAGLVEAHEAGVVHRDLKPANIMIGKATNEAFIMDFGIARLAGAEDGPTPTRPQPTTQISELTQGHTVAGTVVGTFEYMAPEQFRGEVVDQRADLYTTGLILYDMLAGQPRLRGADSPIADAERRTHAAPPALRSLDPHIPEPVEALVSRCLEPKPEDRYQTTRELAEALDRLDDKGHLKPIKRTLTRRLLASAALIVLALLAATWWLARSRAPEVPPDPMSILIADFDNRTGDSTFDGAVEETLSIAMEGAGFISSLPRSSAQKTAEQLQPGSGLDEEMAQLVSRREGIDVVLAGSIEPSGSGYRIDVEARDAAVEAEVDKPLAKASVKARDKEDVLPAVGRLASDLRERLGDLEPESARLASVETFTAASVDAMQAYAHAQELRDQGDYAGAIEEYRRAIEFDPDMGRAYAALAVAHANLGERDKFEEVFQEAMKRIDLMSEREKFRTRGSYYLATGNYDKAVPEYEELVEKYPADRAGHANLALAYFFRREMEPALEEGRLAVELSPSQVPQRNNLALYAMYAGDFETASAQADIVLEMNPDFEKAYVVKAISALGLGDREAARGHYRRLQEVSPRGASFALLGLADVALYEGKLAEAAALLEEGIAHDQGSEFGYDAAVKSVALAQALFEQGDRQAALELAESTLESRRSLSVLVPVARLYVQAGLREQALELAGEMGQKLEPDPQAYGLLIEGEALMAAGNPREALDRFLESVAVADTWLGRCDLGLAYLELEAFTEAHAELDTCFARQGESTSVFLDDRPSFHYFPPVYYYLGRAQEAVGSAAAADSYRAFLAIKEEGDEHPLVADARRRLEDL